MTKWLWAWLVRDDGWVWTGGGWERVAGNFPVPRWRKLISR